MEEPASELQHALDYKGRWSLALLCHLIDNQRLHQSEPCNSFCSSFHFICGQKHTSSVWPPICFRCSLTMHEFFIYFSWHCVLFRQVMVNVQMLAELEEVIQFKLIQERRQTIKDMWWNRLRVTSHHVFSWLSLSLNYRCQKLSICFLIFSVKLTQLMQTFESML